MEFNGHSTSWIWQTGPRAVPVPRIAQSKCWRANRNADATGADGERNHYQLALAATHPNQFDYHVYKLLEKKDLLQDVASVTSTREMLAPNGSPTAKPIAT